MARIRIALAFIKKDVLTMMSYRFDFFVQIATYIFSVCVLYYIGRLVDNADLPFLKVYGGSYFGFIVIGLCYHKFAGVSINTFFGNIRDGQLTGTLEIILASPTRLFTFLLSASLWSYIYTTIRVSLYFLVGSFVFELELGNVNLFAAIIVFIVSMICLIGIGITIASVVLVVKRGEGALKLALGISGILSGLLFPTDILPPLLQKISHFLPLTYSYRGLRLSILEGHSIAQLQGDVIALLGFAIVFMIISMIVFPLAINVAKIEGSLAQY
ncbi:MAG: ABC transporter permease [Promethearchaeota archaeon]|jgi:ABC-2 type transport system permease protein